MSDDDLYDTIETLIAAQRREEDLRAELRAAKQTLYQPNIERARKRLAAAKERRYELTATVEEEVFYRRRQALCGMGAGR